MDSFSHFVSDSNHVNDVLWKVKLFGRSVSFWDVMFCSFEYEVDECAVVFVDVSCV